MMLNSSAYLLSFNNTINNHNLHFSAHTIYHLAGLSSEQSIAILQPMANISF